MRAKPTTRDYSLVGLDAERAVANGLSAAQWYRSDISRKQMKQLMQRSDGPALRDTAIWGACFLCLGAGVVWLWGSWWVLPFLVCYGVLYGSSTDSRWHECGHGTAFRTRWINDVVYQIACFMILREPTIWRWSHTRHHTDTIVVGRDPEIVATRPPNMLALLSNLFAINNSWVAINKLLLHAAGRLTKEEITFVPEMEQSKVYLVARIWLVINAAVIGLVLYLNSWLPVMLVGPLPTMYGAWLAHIFGLTQHAGMAENVLDHRLNSRTVYMNPVFRFIYWNMNYHVEHHMFPMVPYHRLPLLHEILKGDLPAACPGLFAAYREIIPALLKQRKDPDWHIRRQLPDTAMPIRPARHGEAVSVFAE
ncbi:MAG: fatty acid desaturase family protein [Casimicrobiaceae bacterium]